MRYHIGTGRVSNIRCRVTFAPKNVSNDLKQYFRATTWGHGTGDLDARSGRGASLAYTENLRIHLPELLRARGVKVFIDGGCGDFNWMRAVELTGIRYIGLDIVGELIERNRLLYTAPNREFAAADITTDSLPTADLMLCRDCLPHLPSRHVGAFLDNVSRSPLPLLLATTYVASVNHDIDRVGIWRRLDLRRPPFSLPEPLTVIADYPEGYPERYLALWTREQVAAAAAAMAL